MSNFLVLFNEKEGTSNLMKLLDQFQGVSIVHQTDDHGWEPFDWHLHQSLSLNKLFKCLRLVYSGKKSAEKQLNQLYLRSAERPLDHYDKSGDIGFKMRFYAPDEPDWLARILGRWGARWFTAVDVIKSRYERGILSVLRKNKVVVLFAVRQDLFRWALSKYHGDGTGRDGHLQFDVAYERLKRSDVPPIEVDPARFQSILDNRRGLIDEKLRLMHKMESQGIRTHAVIYEEFMTDAHAFFQKLFTAIDHPVTDAEISTVMQKGTVFKKVHSDDISEFVINHEEVEKQFGKYRVDFESEYEKYLKRQGAPAP